MKIVQLYGSRKISQYSITYQFSLNERICKNIFDCLYICCNNINEENSSGADNLGHLLEMGDTEVRKNDNVGISSSVPQPLIQDFPHLQPVSNNLTNIDLPQILSLLQTVLQAANKISDSQ